MIKGSYRKLYIWIEGSWVPFGCLTANGMSEQSELFETTVRDNGGWRSVVPLLLSYSISFEGIVENTVGDATKISLDRLRGYMRNRTLIRWKLEDDDVTVSDNGYGYITALGDAANVGDFVTFSGTIEGTGKAENITGGSEIDNPPSTVRARMFGAEDPPIKNAVLVWNQATDDFGIVGYQIRVEGSDGRSEIIDVPVSFQYTEQVPDGVTYRYNVRAVDTIGQVGAWSNLVAQTGDWGEVVDSKETQSGVVRRRQNGEIQTFQ